VLLDHGTAASSSFFVVFGVSNLADDRPTDRLTLREPRAGFDLEGLLFNGSHRVELGASHTLILGHAAHVQLDPGNGMPETKRTTLYRGSASRRTVNDRSARPRPRCSRTTTRLERIVDDSAAIRKRCRTDDGVSEIRCRHGQEWCAQNSDSHSCTPSAALGTREQRTGQERWILLRSCQ
jgi:hypothetical protein